MTALTVLLTLATIIRVTYLVTADTITEPIRERLHRRWPNGVGYMVSCPWCASVWLAPPIAAVFVWWGDGRGLLVVGLAAAGSLLAGWGKTIEASYDDRTDAVRNEAARARLAADLETQRWRVAALEADNARLREGRSMPPAGLRGRG